MSLYTAPLFNCQLRVGLSCAIPRTSGPSFLARTHGLPCGMPRETQPCMFLLLVAVLLDKQRPTVAFRRDSMLVRSWRAETMGKVMHVGKVGLPWWLSVLCTGVTVLLSSMRYKAKPELPIQPWTYPHFHQQTETVLKHQTGKPGQVPSAAAHQRETFLSTRSGT